MALYNRYITGKKFRPAASDVNAMLDAAERARQGDRPFPDEFGDPRPTSLCLVKNNSGATRSRFSVLGLNGPIITPANNLVEFKSRLTFNGILPAAGTHEGKYCVLLEPLASGKIGTAVLSGVVPIRLTGSQADWAEIANGVTTLASGSSGSARVLYQESGTSQRWAIVRIAEKVVASSSSLTGVRVRLTGTVTLSNGTPTILNWAAEDYDSGSFHDNVTNNTRLTLTSGEWLIGASASFSFNVTGYRWIRLKRTGSQISQNYLDFAVAGSNGADIPLAPYWVHLTSTDYFEIEVMQTSGGNLDMSANSHFWAQKIG